MGHTDLRTVRSRRREEPLEVIDQGLTCGTVPEGDGAGHAGLDGLAQAGDGSGAVGDRRSRVGEFVADL
jgi:hypothetical protein